MEGFSSYWIVIGFVAIAGLLAFALRPKSKRMRHRRQPLRRRDLLRLLGPPIATAAIVALSVAAYVYLKQSR